MICILGRFFRLLLRLRLLIRLLGPPPFNVAMNPSLRPRFPALALFSANAASRICSLSASFRSLSAILPVNLLRRLPRFLFYLGRLNNVLYGCIVSGSPDTHPSFDHLDHFNTVHVYPPPSRECFLSKHLTHRPYPSTSYTPYTADNSQ